MFSDKADTSDAVPCGTSGLSRRRPFVLFIVIPVWIGLVVVAQYLLASYQQAEGSVASPPPAIKADLSVSAERYTLVMVVHPKCPCTMASVYELERLIARNRDQIHCVVLVYSSDRAEIADRLDEYMEGLRVRLPGAEVVADPEGVRAARLGCYTSGSVVLYDSEGEARLWGGITSGRGHAGDNLGSVAVTEVISGLAAAKQPTSVYGCSLGNVQSGPVSSCCEEEAYDD